MLLKYFYDKALAHATYMVGCQRARVAVVVDPGRDIEQYIEMAEREGVKLIAVAETHISTPTMCPARVSWPASHRRETLRVRRWACGVEVSVR